MDDAANGLSDYKIGMTLALTVVVMFSLAGVTTRRLKELHFSIIQYYLGVVGVIVSLIWLIIEQ